MRTSCRRRFTWVATIILVGAGLAGSGVSPLQASVENGRGRVDLQFASPGDEEVGGVAIADDGTVFVAGSTDDDFDGEEVHYWDDGLLFATDRRGRIEWTTLEPGLTEAPGDEVEYFNDVIVHSNGDVYVVGQIEGDGSTNGHALLSRYAPDGELLTRIIWGDTGDMGWDEAQSLVEGPDGRIYVVGYSGLGFGNLTFGRYGFTSTHVVSGDFGAFVAIFDPDLGHDVVRNEVQVDVVWFDEAGDDRAYSITLDDSGAIYIAGRSDENDDGEFDWFVAKFSSDSAHTLLWTRPGGSDPLVNEDGDDRAWEIKYSQEEDALWVGGYLGNAPVVADNVVVGLDRGAFLASLDVSDGSGEVRLCGCNLAELKTLSIDRRGHLILPISLDGDDDWNAEVLNAPLEGGLDSVIIHGSFEDDEDSLWQDSVATNGDDEVVNSNVDRSGNLWLVGTTSGDLARSNGGQDDIFLSLYRNSDRGNSRPAKPTVTWSAIFGSDRFASALAASRNGSTGGAVILVNGRNQTDVLAASLLDTARASTEIGQVLYLDSGAEQVLESVRTELQRIRPTSVSIVGDETSISAEVVASISTLVSLPTPRVTSAEIVDRIIKSAVPSSTLLLIGNDLPTTVLQAISWSNTISGTVLPIDVAIFELERVRMVGFDSLVLVGSPNSARQAAIPIVESTLGRVARLVPDATPGELSASMAFEIGSRPDIAVVSPDNWLDAIHANSVRRPIVWAGPNCVQTAASVALNDLAPTRSINGFGGAIAELGDPRLAPRC